MIEEVIAGGQSGVDIGSLCGARDAKVKTGGFAPKGWLTEKGPQETALRKLGLIECQRGRTYAEKMRARTWENVNKCDAVAILGYRSAGSVLTEQFAEDLGKPYMWLMWNVQVPFRDEDRVRLVEWLLEHKPACLMIGGNREGRNTGIAKAVRPFVRDVLREVNG